MSGAHDIATTDKLIELVRTAGTARRADDCLAGLLHPNPPSSLSSHTMIAEPAGGATSALGGGGCSFPESCRVREVDPVDGWALYQSEMLVGSRTALPMWYACRGEEQLLLNLSVYFFTPTQARFAWLVHHGFPAGVICPRFGARGPLGDDEIDMAIRAEAGDANAQLAIGRVLRFAPALQAACLALVVAAGATSLILVAGGLA